MTHAIIRGKTVWEKLNQLLQYAGSHAEFGKANISPTINKSYRIGNFNKFAFLTPATPFSFGLIKRNVLKQTNLPLLTYWDEKCAKHKMECTTHGIIYLYYDYNYCGSSKSVFMYFVFLFRHLYELNIALKSSKSVTSCPNKLS